MLDEELKYSANVPMSWALEFQRKGLGIGDLHVLAKMVQYSGIDENGYMISIASVESLARTAPMTHIAEHIEHLESLGIISTPNGLVWYIMPEYYELIRER